MGHRGRQALLGDMYVLSMKQKWADWETGRLDRVIRSGHLHSPAKQTLWTPEATG